MYQRRGYYLWSRVSLNKANSLLVYSSLPPGFDISDDEAVVGMFGPTERPDLAHLIDRLLDWNPVLHVLYHTVRHLLAVGDGRGQVRATHRLVRLTSWNGHQLHCFRHIKNLQRGTLDSLVARCLRGSCGCRS